ncbi:MAG: hypothetical protein LBR26_14240 [Prevotella sp.]|nr:hypothetical protein [Prevotella sp.]
MNKAIAVAGAILRKTFTRFFGQGVFSLFFRLGAPYRQIASGDMENGLFVRFPYRIPIIEYKKVEIRNRPVSRIKYLCSN